VEVIVERGCGLDVHQATVVACLLTGVAGAKPIKQIRTFGTTTRELEQLRDWLKAEACTHVLMESTGVYWVPVYAVLEGHFEIVVGNAQRIRNVPGRKSDVKDSDWLSQLLRHGLVEKSFVPPKPIRQLRELLRFRRQLVEARVAERNRLLKLLESANLKLASVASDVFGVSGMAMLRALAAGQRDPAQLAELARGLLRHKLAALTLALEGRFEQHHALLLKHQLKRLDETDAHLREIEQDLDRRMEPYREQQRLLMEIPGVDRILAATLIAELGVDMSVFKSAGHLASWAGLCPGLNQSAGKNLNAHVPLGNPYLRRALVQAATAATHCKRGYLRDKFYRLKARRGYRRAIVATAHKILIALYQMLQTGAHYKDLGDNYLDLIDRSRVKSQLVRRLQRMGYEVILREKVAA
jgi:transposase